MAFEIRAMVICVQPDGHRPQSAPGVGSGNYPDTRATAQLRKFSRIVAPVR